MKITTIGLDLAKSVFHVVCFDEKHREISKRMLRRDQVREYFAQLEPCCVAIEACAGAHYWGRELEKLGYTAKLIPPHDVGSSLDMTFSSRLTDSDGRVTVYQYDPAGRLSEKWFPNGLSARYIWNPDNSLKQLVNRSAANTVFTQHDYTYDGAGNRIKHIEAIAGAAITYDYAYDPLSRLTQVKNGTAAQQEDYSYDPLNNRTRKTVNATTPVITAYTHDAANQLTETRQGSPTGTLLAGYVYDANGNLLKKCEGGTVTTSATTCTGASVTDLSHDGLDRTTRIAKTGQAIQWYGYDDQSRRVRKGINGIGSFYYVYNGPDIAAEYLNQWNAARAVYTHGPNIDDPLIRMTITGSNGFGQADYYHSDGLGSVVALSNNLSTTTQAQRFDAWGNKLGGAITQAAQYGYTGREPDETGLIYYRARYYDPGIGRFTQRDPIGLKGGINQFAYAFDNPVTNTDPDGTEVYIGGHIAASNPIYDVGNLPTLVGGKPAYHLNIVLMPNQPQDFPNRTGWATLANGQPIATLGGQPGGKAGWTDGPLGNLRSSPNNTGDSIFNATFLQRVETPKGMTDTQFIGKLINRANSYQNNQNYDLRPDITSGYNSNSYVAGVLKAAGATPPTLNNSGDFQAPGYDKPIPLNGGGATGSWGTGSQNLNTFVNPPPSVFNPGANVARRK